MYFERCGIVTIKFNYAKFQSYDIFDRGHCFALVGNTLIFTLNVGYLPIDLPGGNYEIRLVSLNLYNSIPNVGATSNRFPLKGSVDQIIFTIR